MTTLRDVAKYAGVSVATVSRTISKPLMVSPKTRQLVDNAINATGYCDVMLGRRLKPQSRIIMAILPCLHDPYFTLLLDYLNHRAKQLGYHLLALDSGRPEHLKQELLKCSITRKVDGIILLGAESSTMLFDTIKDQLPPLVFACDSRSNYDYPTVSIDNLTASFYAVNHLITLGHKLIAQITGPDSLWVMQQRHQGYQQALRRASIPINSTYSISKAISLKSGAEACASLLQLPTPPTAIFCHNDLFALGALKEALKQKVNVPNQLSIIGFNGIKEMEYSHPGLTTISQPYEQLLESALQLLIAQINGRTIQKPNLLLEATLVERDSVSRWASSVF